MALILSFLDGNGDTFSYWRIDITSTDYSSQSAHVVSRGYKSKAAAKNNKRPSLEGVQIYDFQSTPQIREDGIVIPAFSAIFGNDPFRASKTTPREILYNWFKTLPEWAGATDDIDVSSVTIVGS